jgi:hypothetical protein
VAADVTKPFREQHAGLEVEFVGLEGLIARATASRRAGTSRKRGGQR